MNNYEYNKIAPFKWFILENFPLIDEDFDALTNWQLFCKLGKEMNKLIASQNNVGEEMERLSKAYIALENYVNNYFDNLDLQTEIDNKLDEMVENGTLSTIIGQYISYELPRCFSTITELIASNLEDGASAITLGYTTIGDNGGAKYYITDTEPASNESYVQLANNNYAVLVNEGFATPEMFGAIGDGVTNDITALNNCKAYCIANNILMKSSANKTYGLLSGFTITTGFSCDFGNATFKALQDMSYVVRQNKQIATHDGYPVNSEYTKNIVVDCDHKADYGFYQDELGWSVLTENIRVLNPKTIGIYIKKGQVRLHNAKIEEEMGYDVIGLQVDSSDSEYYNVVCRDCKTAIKVTNGSNGFYECHPAYFRTELLPGSIAFDVSARCLFVHPIADTCQYGFYIRHFGGCDIISPELVIHPRLL